VPFGYSLHDWANVVGVTDWNSLGFIDYSECERMGWSTHDMYDLHIVEREEEPVAPPNELVASKRTDAVEVRSDAVEVAKGALLF